MPCATIKNCDFATHHRLEGELVSVGVRLHDTDRFYVLCIKDGVGCQHVTAKNERAFILMERLSRILRIAA